MSGSHAAFARFVMAITSGPRTWPDRSAAAHRSGNWTLVQCSGAGSAIAL